MQPEDGVNELPEVAWCVGSDESLHQSQIANGKVAKKRSDWGKTASDDVKLLLHTPSPIGSNVLGTFHC
jgi:hypothetical protein